MGEGNIAYAWILAFLGSGIGIALGFYYARSGNKKAPAVAGAAATTLSRTRDQYKDYRDSVTGEFVEINDSIRVLNAAYGKLLDNIVNNAEKLRVDNKEVLQRMSSDRLLIATRQYETQESSPAATQRQR